MVLVVVRTRGFDVEKTTENSVAGGRGLVGSYV